MADVTMATATATDASEQVTFFDDSLLIELVTVCLVVCLALLYHKKQKKDHRQQKLDAKLRWSGSDSASCAKPVATTGFSKARAVPLKKSAIDLDIEKNATAGENNAVISLWNSNKEIALCGSTLPLVAKSLVEVRSPQAAINELQAYVEKYPQCLDTVTRASVFDAINPQTVGAVEQMLKFPFVDVRDMRALGSALEVAAGVYAQANEKEKLEDIMDQLDSTRTKVSAKCLSKVLRSHLKHNNALEALSIAKQMLGYKYNVAPFLVTDVFRALIKRGMGNTALDHALPELQPTSHSAMLLLEHYGAKVATVSRAEDAKVYSRCAKRLMDIVRNNSDTPARAHVLHAVILMQAGDSSGAVDELDAVRQPLSEQSVLQLLEKCAELGLVSVADNIVQHKKTRVTQHIEQALNKVYLNRNVGTNAGGLPVKFSETFEEEGKQDSRVVAIRACGNPKAAVKLLHEAVASGHKDLVLFNCALDVCATAGDVQTLRQVLTFAKKEASPSVITYNTALKAFAVSGNLIGARELLYEMEHMCGVTPNEISYNIVLNIAAGDASFAECWRLVEDMRKQRVRIDHFTIATLLKAAKKASSKATSWSKASAPLDSVLQLMDNLQIEASSDEVMLSSVLEMCLANGKRERIVKVLADAPFSHLSPSKQAFGTIMQAAADIDDVEKCLMLWQRMTNECGLEPSRLTLESMLSALAKSGCIGVAVELLEKWKGRIAPTGNTYKALLNGLEGSLGKSGAALIKELSAAGLKMKTLVFNIIIESEAKNNKANDIEEILDLMKQEGCQPDTFTTALQIKALCNCGKLKAAFRAFEEGTAATGRVDTVAYNTLLDGCIRMNENKMADRLITTMDACGVQPSNFTLGTIIKLYGKRQQLDKCFEVCDEFRKKYGIATDNTIKNCIMSACILNNSVDVCLEVYRAMTAENAQMEARTLLSIIGLCRRNHRIDDAMWICKDLVGSRVSGLRTAEHHELQALAAALDKAGRFDDLAVPVYRRLRDIGVHLPRWVEQKL
eukprot:TRINITY_DN4750_c0_g1_i1.p1 TRINITY_DN4750_c0_g1~~TRINITY_DN4750_c0_g1_i1.p1  ORF type:complete len:1017 (-),score=367.10 TRINITY_DN4750_c0_g1_i1:210-3260(-)